MSYDPNQYDCFVMALVLAIIAPTNEQSERAVELAESLAPSLTSLQIESAKNEAAKKAGL